MKIKDDVVAGKRPATRLFLADVPDYVKEMTSQCWAQEPDDRPAFSGTNLAYLLNEQKALRHSNPLPTLSEIFTARRYASAVYAVSPSVSHTPVLYQNG